MRKARAVLISAVMVLGVSLTIGATPAQAEKLVGAFRDYSECQRIGSHGVAQGWWEGYSCVWESRYRYYFLYT
ncbi:hypothetical protein DI270_016115 [Microbispora triticiradicis]|uniref:Uncharacterized protein n=3 Tax=Microbispora TaxID=2005 RepID=A0ABY3M332_9ACTN|nr:hypothetical protein DI270_016115 [Microbispora triticiradicis]TLP53991.1 hypothetical protein FED44_28505 [Microbispora fusca]TYB65155.1 hypothetical protein FXF59_06770 [Microbispora tritici]GLW24958.1 hypothetical protein Mame01_50000 [Microbispora amethystogenes]